MRSSPLILCLLCCSLLPAEESRSKRFVLGGPRKVVAEVAAGTNDLKIDVEMVAVGCFDQATNKRLSRSKAEHYAHEAIARFLFPKESNQVTFLLSGTTIERSVLDGKLYRMTLRVPRNGITRNSDSERREKRTKDSASEASEVAVRRTNEETASAKINLFEVKGDYAQTLRLLTESFETSIPALPERSTDEQQEAFFKAVADFEGMAKRGFKVLAAEIRQDKLLLTIEADELVQQVERDQADLMDRLKESFESLPEESFADPPDVKKKFSEIEIDEPFDRYLLANSLLMEASGAKIIKLKNGNKVVLSVASTVLKDDSAKERLRAEKVCRVKALASVVAEKQGVMVAHTEELKEQTKIVIDEKGETGKSVSDLIQITKTKTEGIAKDMPVVGRWNSKDGDVFYLAIGVILDKNGEPLPDEDGTEKKEKR